MIDLKQKCIHWYHNEFKLTTLWDDMVNTTEDSPWHRERNVAIHTDMVVSQYLSRVNTNVWRSAEVIGFLTVVFHDVGKPSSEIIKFKEDRGEYRAYHGHELVSARLFENYICENLMLLDELYLKSQDIHGISWLIEHHVPWDTKHAQTRAMYAKSVINIFKSDIKLCNDNKTFFNILMSDTDGRISDDQSSKTRNASNWINEFQSLINFECCVESNTNTKTLYLPIAVSGTGKSTYYNTLRDVVTFSLDDLREDWYPADNYNESFKLACDDDKFSNKANAKFMNMIKAGDDIYVDNTNLSKKRRRFYVDEARKRGYRIIGLVFPISLKELEKRQTNRIDKVIPKDVYTGMYKNLQQPSYGECDEIKVIL